MDCEERYSARSDRRTVVPAGSVQKRQRILRDEVSHVFRFAHQFSVLDHGNVVVRTAPFQVNVPVGKPFCGLKLSPKCHLPLKPQTYPLAARISV